MLSLFTTTLQVVANACFLLAALRLGSALSASRSPKGRRPTRAKVGAAKRRVAVSVPQPSPPIDEEQQLLLEPILAITSPTGNGGGEYGRQQEP